MAKNQQKILDLKGKVHPMKVPSEWLKVKGEKVSCNHLESVCEVLPQRLHISSKLAFEPFFPKRLSAAYYSHKPESNLLDFEE